MFKIAQLLEALPGALWRSGGDEFAVISFEDAQSTAEKMSRVNLQLREEARAYTLQICAGVYRRQEQDDERRVFELADSALYQAKQNGRARAVIYADEFAMH